jgi:hypothetical protein
LKVIAKAIKIKVEVKVKVKQKCEVNLAANTFHFSHLTSYKKA